MSRQIKQDESLACHLSVVYGGRVLRVRTSTICPPSYFQSSSDDDFLNEEFLREKFGCIPVSVRVEKLSHIESSIWQPHLKRVPSLKPESGFEYGQLATSVVERTSALKLSTEGEQNVDNLTRQLDNTYDIVMRPKHEIQDEEETSNQEDLHPQSQADDGEYQENAYWQSEIEKHEDYLSDYNNEYQGGFRPSEITTPPSFQQNKYYEAALNLTNSLFPESERATLRSAISIMRIDDITTFKEILRILETNLQHGISECHKILEDIEKEYGNYNPSSSLNKRDNGSQTEQTSGGLEESQLSSTTRENNSSHQAEIESPHMEKIQSKGHFTPTSGENHRPDKINGRCSICARKHHIWQCKRLLAMRAKEKTMLIGALNLCYKCLSKHKRDNCQFGNCPHCNGPHNIILCYKLENQQNQSKETREKCPLCERKHNLWKCKMMQNKRIGQRKKIIRAFGLCYKCFSRHQHEDCTKNNCLECGGPHHLLLCYQKKIKTEPESKPEINEFSASFENNSEDDWTEQNWEENYP